MTRQISGEGANHAGMGHYHGTTAFDLVGNCIHRVANSLAEMFQPLSSGSRERRIVIEPPLCVGRILRHDLVPIQSLPTPEGNFTERTKQMNR